MKLKLWQVDAFAAKPFEGNPAAIVPLDSWLADSLMQKIANENNLAETAFFVAKAKGRYDLRWFTPKSEVELCGHATLASGWTIFRFLDSDLKQVAFETKSGTLHVERGADGSHIMSLPSDFIVPLDEPGLAAQLGEALDSPPPALTLKGRYIVAVWEKAGNVRRLKGPGEVPRVLRRHDVWGLIATAPGDESYDFVSRFFAPDKGVPEDPVTGSAHTALGPYWAEILGKTELTGYQASSRGGVVRVRLKGDRVILAGQAVTVMTGELKD
jgi:PhzF family phenazine biosynthesis protein